jgi:hypothetical protein
MAYVRKTIIRIIIDPVNKTSTEQYRLFTLYLLHYSAVLVLNSLYLVNSLTWNVGNEVSFNRHGACHERGLFLGMGSPMNERRKSAGDGTACLGEANDVPRRRAMEEVH